MRRRIVVVGYGIAGLTAADTLREEGFDGEIVVVGAEPDRPYSRPALSKAVLAAAADDHGTTGLHLPDPAHGGAELLGRRATGLRPAERTVLLDEGTTLAYDGIVIATGSTPRRFTDSPDEYTLRTLADARALRARLARRPGVVVLGGGPLGTEIASSARALGCEVTVVERGTPMVRQTGTFLGELCTRAALDHGVRVVDALAADVRAAGPAGSGLVVTLDSGEVLGAEVLVSAIGDRVNDDWLADSGLLTGGRLLVDERARVLTGTAGAGVSASGVPVPDIVAAGDVAWLPSVAGPRRVPLWMHAIDHAKAAARGLLHGDEAEPYAQRPYFWTEQFGLHLRMCGPVPEGEPVVVDGDPRDGSALLRWDGPVGDTRVDGRAAAPAGTAVAVNYKISVPKLRRLAATMPAVA